MGVQRCFGEQSDLYRAYHDEEWGVPVHDDRLLFEYLILEGAQAGLSWLTVLHKRQHYRQVFCNFDVRKVAALSDERLAALRDDAGIIRNRAKIAATVQNARALMRLCEEQGSFDAYLWRFVDGAPIQGRWQRLQDIPAKTSIAEALSKDLRRRGFSFVGPTICYAFMQAVGMANDHILGCFRQPQVAGLAASTAPTQPEGLPRRSKLKKT